VETWQNVIDFARALRPSRIVAFHGSDVELLPLAPFEPLVGRRTTLLGRSVPTPARSVEPDRGDATPRPVIWIQPVDKPASAGSNGARQ
jgi:hypothetical protein